MLNSFASRRDWLRATAIGATGFSASGWLDVLAARAATTPAKPRYKQCIVLWLTGGPSHLDTWDMKPDVPVEQRSVFKPAATAVPGIQITEMLPKIAQRMNRLAIVRGMTGSNVHPAATMDLHGAGVFKQTGVKQPSLGAAVSAVHDLNNFNMPTHIVIGQRSRFDSLIPGPGFLGPRHSMMLIQNPADKIDSLTPAVETAELQTRLSLLDELQQGFSHQHKLNIVNSHAVNQQNAVSFMHSPKAKSFDIGMEPEKLRDSYGRNQFGNGCVMVRRLIEIGVPFVEVKWTQSIRKGFVANELPWDTHEDVEGTFKTGLPMLDAGFSTLLDDLQARGLLDSTLIVCMAEFGRTPKLERRGGRDHYGKAFSMVLAGGGIKSGQVIGKTDDQGGTVVDRPVSPSDLMATICLALGIDPALEFGSRDGRPLEGLSVNQQMAAGAPVRVLPRSINPIKEVLA